MTPKEIEEANAAKPLRLRVISSAQACDAIERGDGEVIALYLRQMVQPGKRPDAHFLKWLADVFDPKSKEKKQFISAARGPGRPTADGKHWQHHFESKKPLAALVVAELARLEATNPALRVTRAVELVAEKSGKSTRTVWRAVRSAGLTDT